MLAKKKTKYVLATVILISAIPLTCCASTRKAENPAGKPVQIQTAFPSPYDENGNAVVSLDGDTVSMPLWYWLKITDYVIDTEANKELLED